MSKINGPAIPRIWVNYVELSSQIETIEFSITKKAHAVTDLFPVETVYSVRIVFKSFIGLDWHDGGFDITIHHPRFMVKGKFTHQYKPMTTQNLRSYLLESNNVEYETYEEDDDEEAN